MGVYYRGPWEREGTGPESAAHRVKMYRRTLTVERRAECDSHDVCSRFVTFRNAVSELYPHRPDILHIVKTCVRALELEFSEDFPFSAIHHLSAYVLDFREAFIYPKVIERFSNLSKVMEEYAFLKLFDSNGDPTDDVVRDEVYSTEEAAEKTALAMADWYRHGYKAPLLPYTPN